MEYPYGLTSHGGQSVRVFLKLWKTARKVVFKEPAKRKKAYYVSYNQIRA